jgi:hypothetical protein
VDEIASEGFAANGQDEPRDKNPYLAKAIAWDQGWVSREREVLIHRLEREAAEHLPSFREWVAERADLDQ